MCKKKIGSVAVVVGLVLFFFITPLRAEEKISSTKKKLIKELIEITGVKKEAEDFFGGIDAILGISPGKQSESLFSEGKALEESINEIYFPLYDKNFTESELKELLRFYKSPVGRKVVKMIPNLSIVNLAMNKQMEEILEKAKKETKKAQINAQKLQLRTECMLNLRKIGVVLQMYAYDHDEKFPKSLKELYPDYLAKDDILRCPAKNISYTYVKGLTNADSGDTPIVYDSSVENHGDGRNVLFVDGHTKWYQEEEFQKLLKKVPEPSTLSKESPEAESLFRSTFKEYMKFMGEYFSLLLNEIKEGEELKEETSTLGFETKKKSKREEFLVSNKKKWQRIVNNFQKIYDEYPKSKWADDALYVLINGFSKLQIMLPSDLEDMLDEPIKLCREFLKNFPEPHFEDWPKIEIKTARRLGYYQSPSIPNSPKEIRAMVHYRLATFLMLKGRRSVNSVDEEFRKIVKEYPGTQGAKFAQVHLDALKRARKKAREQLEKRQYPVQ